MYAIIQNGGKQYRVSEGQMIRLETIDAEPGKSIDLNEILLIANDKEFKIGAPFVKGAKVKAEVVTHGRAKKIEILKFKRRKQHLKRMGHRQNFTQVKITKIEG